MTLLGDMPGYLCSLESAPFSYARIVCGVRSHQSLGSVSMPHIIALACFALAALFWGLFGASGAVFFGILAMCAEAVAWYQLLMRKDEHRSDVE